MSANKVSEWIRSALKNEDISDYQIQVHGDTGKSTGYWGQMIFVTVTGKSTSGHNKTLHLVVKSSPSSPLLRSQVPVKQLFEKEIDIYAKVIPAFKNLQRELGLKDDLLNFVAKCYLTRADDNEEIVILRNLKPDGFDLCNRLIPLDFDCVKLVLQAFARWHAFSFALRRKQPEVFASLVKNNRNMFPYYIWKVGINDVIYRAFDEVRTVWKKDREIAEGLTFSKNDINFVFGDLFLQDAEHQVILHGDCWTNNLLFKLQEGSKSTVCLIDWQCSGLASPVMDLSYVIYSCVDTEVHENVKELLSVYYSSLSDSLQQLDCDPVEIFPYERLVEHWKQFSSYGLILVTFLMKFFFAERVEAPNFAAAAEQGKDFLENFDFTIANEEIYYKRSKGNFLHYLRNLRES